MQFLYLCGDFWSIYSVHMQFGVGQKWDVRVSKYFFTFSALTKCCNLFFAKQSPNCTYSTNTAKITFCYFDSRQERAPISSGTEPTA